MTKWTLLLISLLYSFVINAQEYPHRQKPTDPPLFETLAKMQKMILTIEPRNGVIIEYQTIATRDSGFFLLDICENTDAEHIEYGCSTFSTLGVDIEYGLPEYGQHNIYYKPDLIIDGYKVVEALIIDSTLQELTFNDNLTGRYFSFRSNQELQDSIKNKITLGDLDHGYHNSGNDVVKIDELKQQETQPVQN
ncbi:hypothetical protein [Pseudoalteromonas pernae]|uniref:hypothetical protein n=1 Tax=Pseudoalteromonas pernae TaxID=3118054 RepID=UPI003241BF06